MAWNHGVKNTAMMMPTASAVPTAGNISTPWHRAGEQTQQPVPTVGVQPSQQSYRVAEGETDRGERGQHPDL